MLEYLIKGADGKSDFITMETLGSDSAKVLPTLKIIIFVLIVGFVSGYFRMMLLGFHPVLQGALLGLVMGTLGGKTLAIGEQIPKNSKFLHLFSFLISIAVIAVHYYAMGIALPASDTSFLLFSWHANDIREISNLIPSLGIGSMLEAHDRVLWLVSCIVDAIILTTVVIFTLPQAARTQKRGKNPQSSWKMYRMLVLFFGLYGSVLFTQKDQFGENSRKLVTWTDEVWSHHYLNLLYQNIDGVHQEDTGLERIQIEEVLLKAAAMDREFPEGHYLSAVEQLSKGNYYLAKDELGRSIFEAEQMTRRTWLEDGTAIHRDLLLANLYQLRAKLSLQKENNLLAERDLSVAIFIYEDFWPEIPDDLNDGFFRPEPELLKKAGYDSDFSFGACHYERYLARKTLDEKQAMEDLKEAKSLGYSVSEEVKADKSDQVEKKEG